MARSPESSGPPGSRTSHPRHSGTQNRPSSSIALASAREIVVQRLARQGSLFPDFDLAPLDTGTLDDRDAALAHSIYDSALRWWLTLEHLLNASLRQPFTALEPAVRGVLLSGATQLLLLDRIPPHAALNESVEIAKRFVRPGAGALVNAVLRKIAALRADTAPRPDSWTASRSLIPLSGGHVRLLAAPALPEGPADRLAIATSHPRPLIESWTTSLSPAQAASLALHSLIAPPTILNTAYATSPLPGAIAPHSRPGHHVFTGPRRDLSSLLESRPDLWVQDPASSAAVETSRHLRSTLIVDVCAGQGTKTRQLAAAFPASTIIATDVDPDRYRTLAEFWRGNPRVRVLPIDDAAREAAGRADLILLDVPCSNTGVLARRVEAKYRCGQPQLERLIAIQRQIIDRAVPLLAPGGHMLYSTCSIDERENQSQCLWARERHGLLPSSPSLLLPASLPGDDASLYHDGSFSSLLTRPA